MTTEQPITERPSPHPYYDDEANWESIVPRSEGHADYPPYATPAHDVQTVPSATPVTRRTYKNEIVPRIPGRPFLVIRPASVASHFVKPQNITALLPPQAQEQYEPVMGHYGGHTVFYTPTAGDEQRSRDDAWFEYDNDEEWNMLPT